MRCRDNRSLDVPSTIQDVALGKGKAILDGIPSWNRHLANAFSSCLGSDEIRLDVCQYFVDLDTGRLTSLLDMLTCREQ